MMHQQLNKIVCKVWNININVTRCSALFINGPRATQQFAYISPHIDLSDKIQHKQTLQNELDRRKTNIDLEKVIRLWQVYDELNKTKTEYIKKKEEISRELGKIINIEPHSDYTKELKIKIDMIKENLKKIKVPLWSAEEAAMLEALNLPNNLHFDTPDLNNKILYTHLTLPEIRKDHLKVGKELNIIDFKRNNNYYLKGDAAVFELGAKFYFNKLLRTHNFVQFSNPDFVKSLIVEGCGIDHTNSDHTFIIHHHEDSTVNIDSRLHLTGGASLCSFLAYHAKNVINTKVLPLKYFTMGRKYVPALSEEDNLFNVSQSSVIEVFGATKTEHDADVLVEQLVNILKEAYTALGYHFCLSIVSADKLQMWESLRIIIQMYSSSKQDYVEVASISLSGDFISKRLMFTYVENKDSKYPYIVSGTLLNVPKLLACVMEQDQHFTVPELFKVQNWTV